MSTVLSAVQNRVWVQAAALLVGACLVVVGISWVVRPDDSAAIGARVGAALGTFQVDARPWVVTVFPAGAMGHPTKAESARVKHHRGKLADLLDRVYDAVWLDANKLESALLQDFAPAAARAFRRSMRPLPENASVIRIRKRYARIGVDARRAKTAAASVSLLIEGKAQKPFRIKHKATLWLERRGRWRVIAFELRQGAT
jgi:hypothetical protein